MAFLVWKNQDGRTLIHKPECGFALQQQRSQCACLKGLAFGTENFVIGKLRAIFVRHSREAEGHSVLGVGNLASCRTVKDYLASVCREQLINRLRLINGLPHVKQIQVCSRMLRSFHDLFKENLFKESCVRCYSSFCVSQRSSPIEGSVFLGGSGSQLVRYHHSNNFALSR